LNARVKAKGLPGPCTHNRKNTEQRFSAFEKADAEANNIFYQGKHILILKKFFYFC
jgi:hypothetical protein